MELSDYDAIKNLVMSAKGKFISVEFIKKDGTVRLMNIQPSTIKKHVKGENASPSARQAVETRKRNHPNLMAVWDTKANAIRSINIDTIKKIKIDGQVHTWENGTHRVTQG